MEFLPFRFKNDISILPPDGQREIEDIETIINATEENKEVVAEKICDLIELSKCTDHASKIINHAIAIRPCKTKLLLDIAASVSEKKNIRLKLISSPFTEPLPQFLVDDDVEGLKKFLIPEKCVTVRLNKVYEGHFEQENISIMKACALFGAVKCFKYLFDGIEDFSEYTRVYAIAGGNEEIIRLIEEKGVSFEDCLLVAMIYHRFNLYEWIQSKYSEQILPFDKCIMFYNYPIFCSLYESCRRTQSYGFLEKTLICYSTKFGALGITEFLIQNNCDLHVVNAEGNLLHIASSYGNVAIIKLLLSKRIPILRNSYGFTPILTAAKNDCFDAVKFFLENGSGVNENGDPQKHFDSLLHIAVKCGDFELVKYVVEKGANVDYKNKERLTPLYYSLSMNYQNINDFLLSKGAVYDADMLCHAIKENNDSVFSFLIDCGIELKPRRASETPLCCAINKGIKFCEALLIKGADINLHGTEEDPPIIIAISKNRKSIVDQLLNKGVNCNVQGKNGNSTLIEAILNHNKEVAMAIIRLGVNVNEKNNHGYSALHFASYFGYKEIVESLIRVGANVNDANYLGNTPLHYSLFHIDVVQVLLDAGANIKLKNADGNTASKYAKDRGRDDVAKLTKPPLFSF